MAVSLAQNAIALLIDLAERQEIDPWDVKVIEVIDRFLSKLQPGQNRSLAEGRVPYEADLSESGQAFLYASMLLLLKADSLARQETAEEEVVEEEFLEESNWSATLPPNLERRIRRRAVAPAAPNRRVTLQELIAQLNLIAVAMADPKPRRLMVRRPRPQSRSQAIRAIAQLAHQENLSEVAAILEQFLADYWVEGEQEHWLDFEALLHLWSQAQPEQSLAKPPTDLPDSQVVNISGSPSVHDRVGVFWALLFLAAQSKVELLQEEFYQDLLVRKFVPDAPAPDSAPPSEMPAYVLPD